jgi:PAS domain S-box-containing protein
MKAKSPLNRKVQVAFVSAIVALLVVGAASCRGMIVSGESERWVRHTHDVLENLQELLFAAESIESSYRGFVLSGRESFVQSYRASISAATQGVATVRYLTADNPRQQGKLLVIEGLIARDIQIGEMAIRTRQTRNLDATVDAIRGHPGEQIMNELQGVLREMQEEERRLLVLRTAEARRRLAETKIVVIFGTVLGLLIAAGAGWASQRNYSKRGRAEGALRDSEEKYRVLVSRDLSESEDSGAKYRGLLEAAPDAMVVVNSAGKIVLLNVQAEKQFGYTRDELLGQRVKNIIPQGFAERLIADGTRSAAEALAQQIGTGIELIARRKDGSEFPIEIMLSPLESAEGILVTAAIRNITVRKDAEKHLAQMEGRYRGLLEAAPDAMVVVSQGGDIVLLNVQAEKQFGYRRDELVGQQVTNIIPEGFAERLIADGTRSAAEALAQQIGTGIELVARRKNGSAFPIEIMLSPLESAEGILVTAAIRDISVRKGAEEHLAQMEGRYRGLLEAAPDAMVVVNQDGDIVLLNVQAEKQFGYSRDELVGQRVKNIIPEGFAERLIADGLRSAEDALAQQIGTGIELKGRRKDGTEFPLEIMLSPLESAEGILVTAAIRDITTRRMAEAHLLYKVEELNRSNEELGQFAYIASHDLQEPLRMVASYTQLLSRRYKGKLDADADEFIAFAVDGANRMQRLIQDLLAYSRVGTKRMDLSKTSSEEALREALVNLRGAIAESGALVTHDPLPSVLADETQLIQLFQNLVGNAIKYQSPGVPRVHISIARNGDEKWMFSVRDNGLGIDPQYFEKIFGMFQRLHKREEFAGTGIGLAICKKIVERHGSTISVESQLGQGSTFRFALTGSEKKSRIPVEVLACP